MSNNQQPEALRLAHLLALDKWPDAAAELRRLHACVQELQSEASENARIIGIGVEAELRLRAQVEELERRLESTLPWLVHYGHQRTAMRECHEALAACISLLKKTPKATQSMFVGKDQQAWGVQAKAVLEAALAAYAKQGEQS